MSKSRDSSPRTRRVLSIRWIVSGAAIALTAVTVLVVGGLWERNTRQALNRESGTRLMLAARNLALTSTQALLSEYPELILQPILGEMQTDQPELAFAVVLDRQREIRGHLDSRMLGTAFQMPEGLEPNASLIGLDPEESLNGNADLLVASAPVRHPSGETIGTVAVGFHRDEIKALLRDARRNQLFVVAALLVIGTLAATALMSLLLRPIRGLREGLERIGRGDLETPVKLRDRTEFGLLAATMNEMSARIRTAQAEMLEKERLSKEVELAREIQASLLPADETRVFGFVIDGANRPAAEVGGDYYDVFPLPSGKIGIAVADVSGKGLAGCMVSSMLSALLRAFRFVEFSPSALLIRLEQHLCESLLPGTFITMFYALLDPLTGKLTYASAAHSPTLLYRGKSRKVEWLRTRGIPIGAVRGGALGKTLEDYTVKLEPGDLLVQYTDGINEAFDPAGKEQFGFERLAETVVTAAPRGCREVINSIRDAVQQWSMAPVPEDDETMIVVSWEGVTEEQTDPKLADQLAAEVVVRNEVGSAASAQAEALRALAEARRLGHRLALPAELAALTRIRAWIDQCPGLRELSPDQATVLESGLFEACANIIEHGYREDRTKSLDLWWLPGPSGELTELTRTGIEDQNPKDPAAQVRVGRFVIIDNGPPFQPPEGMSVDLSDPAVRRRGRGLGLEIIREAMSFITYYPATPEGNVTLLGFDPAKAGSSEEIRHAK